MSQDSFAPIVSALKEIQKALEGIARRLRQLEAVEHPGAVCRWRGLSAGAPATPAEGDVYYDTGTAFVYIYANGGWRQLS